MKFDHIFFDSGGTLYGPGTGADPSPAQAASEGKKRLCAMARGMGVHLDFERVEQAVNRQKAVCQQRFGKAYTFLRLMQAVVDELGLPFGREAVACLADAYVGPRYRSWLFPGTEDALRALSDSGYRLGVIANTAWPGFSMDRAFAGVGLLPYFGIRIYSGDIGIQKPDPAIFRLAERIGGLEGKRMLYVGNDLTCDIEGAAAVGWSTAFRRGEPATTAGLADVEFDHISELVAYCLDS